MTTNHTPWKANSETGYRWTVQDCHGRNIVTGINNYPHDEDTARLIAAAPETAAKLAEVTAERDRLRWALAELVRTLPEAGTDDYADTLDAARAALANTTPPAPDPLRDAAPELLACLVQMTAMWEAALQSINFQPNLARNISGHIARSNAAIAKAEGRP